MTDAEREVIHLQQKDEDQQREIDELKGDMTRLLDRIQILEARFANAARAFSEEF